MTDYAAIALQGVINQLDRKWRDNKQTFRGASVHERLFSKVVKTDECWVWVGAVSSGGYGTLTMPGGKTRRVHKLSWELVNGEVPKGLCVLHKCDIRRCVNPSHLYVGTGKDNMRDLLERKPFVRQAGENHPGARLKWDQVDAIRASNLGIREIAAQFNISRQHVSKIRRGQFWRRTFEKGRAVNGGGA